jgi:hypothetical protein
MLNHTSHLPLVACRQRLHNVTRRFIELASLTIFDALGRRKSSALEITRAQLSLFDKLYGLFALRFAAQRHADGIARTDPAAILFTSVRSAERRR